MRWIYWITPLIPFTLLACQGAGSPTLDEAERQAIRRMSAEWMDAHEARDWDRLVRHYTEDAVLLPPMAPAIRGREAIRTFFAENESDTRVEVAILEIEGCEDLAYVRGTSTVTMGLSTENPVTFSGKYLDIRRRTPSGRWLVSVDMFSPDTDIR